MEKIKELFAKYKEIILYVFFGGLTTVVSWCTYAICVCFFRLANPGLVMTDSAGVTANFVSTTISWIISVTFAYFTNRKWVFESKKTGFRPIMLEMLGFFSFRLLSFFMELAIMYVTVNIMNFNELVMKLVANVFVVIVNYVFSKLFIFKKNKNASDEKSKEKLDATGKK